MKSVSFVARSHSIRNWRDRAVNRNHLAATRPARHFLAMSELLFADHVLDELQERHPRFHARSYLFVLEALACGTPVVQPAHGAFPEMLESTGGGVLVEPGSVKRLAEGLRELRDDPARRRELGERGRAKVHREYDDATMADRTEQVYRRYVEGG